MLPAYDKSVGKTAGLPVSLQNQYGRKATQYCEQKRHGVCRHTLRLHSEGPQLRGSGVLCSCLYR